MTVSLRWAGPVKVVVLCNKDDSQHQCLACDSYKERGRKELQEIMRRPLAGICQHECSRRLHPIRPECNGRPSAKSERTRPTCERLPDVLFLTSHRRDEEVSTSWLRTLPFHTQPQTHRSVQ